MHRQLRFFLIPSNVMCWVRAFFHSIKSNLPYIIKKQPVIIDADVAALYGVEAKRINEPVRNNPNKFPKE